MPVGQPTSEKLVQDYTSKWYKARYSGNGFLYHSRIVTDMLSGLRFKDHKQSDKVIDIGCGTGFVSQLYPNFDIVGIDISDGMLAQNPHKWIKASAEQIPFPDDHFAWVICRSLLHHLDDPMAGLVEMNRVLKPGGQWVCWDPHHGLLYNMIRKIFQHTDRFSHLHKSFNSGVLSYLIEESGFEITETRHIGYLAYPLLGFPDIIKFPLPLTLARSLIKLDDAISRTPLRRLSWSLMVKARKV